MTFLFMNNIKGAACYGVERWMLTLAAGLRRRGHRIIVAARPDSGMLRASAAAGLDVLPLRVRAGLGWAQALRLRAFMARHGVDGICVKNYKHLRMAALARTGLPAALVCRRGSTGDIADSLRHRQAINACADAVIVPSEALKAEFARIAWLDPRRVIVLPHEIDAAAAAAARPAAGLPACACRVVFAGCLSPVKGTDLLLQAWRRVHDRAPGARLLLVGASSGPDYRGLAAALGVADTVDFAGYQEDAKPWIAASDVLVLPSRREGAGFVLLEAMALGRPCVGTRVGGIPEYLADGVSGLLIPPDDDAALADALLALIGDPDRRRRLGAAGRLRIDTTFAVGRSVPRFEALMADLRARRGRRITGRTSCPD